MFHDNFHDEALWSKLAVMIVESIVPDKHVKDVSVIGAGYILIVMVCNSYRCALVFNIVIILIMIIFIIQLTISSIFNR